MNHATLADFASEIQSVANHAGLSLDRLEHQLSQGEITRSFVRLLLEREVAANPKRLLMVKGGELYSYLEQGKIRMNAGLRQPLQPAVWDVLRQYVIKPVRAEDDVTVREALKDWDTDHHAQEVLALIAYASEHPKLGCETPLVLLQMYEGNEGLSLFMISPNADGARELQLLAIAKYMPGIPYSSPELWLSALPTNYDLLVLQKR